MILPTRITLRTGNDGPVCSFTALFKFNLVPQRGHKLIFVTPGHRQVGVVIDDVCHFVPEGDDEPVCLCFTTPLVIEEYDDLLRVVDWFKATYEVQDFSSMVEPEPYYKFYRRVAWLLGLSKTTGPKIGYDPQDVKVFAEACRSVILAELNPSDEETNFALVGFNPSIRYLYELVLDRKREEPDGADMLLVIKTWEQLLNSSKMMQWSASDENCLKFARVVFARHPSIPPDHLPSILRTK